MRHHPDVARGCATVAPAPRSSSAALKYPRSWLALRPSRCRIGADCFRSRRNHGPLPANERRPGAPGAAKPEWLTQLMLVLQLTSSRLRLLSAWCGPLGARTLFFLRFATPSSHSELIHLGVVSNRSLPHRDDSATRTDLPPCRQYHSATFGVLRPKLWRTTS